jgi:hypothetical protein
MVSNGCVNVATEYFPEFWDHLQSGSRVYVTPFNVKQDL